MYNYGKDRPTLWEFLKEFFRAPLAPTTPMSPFELQGTASGACRGFGACCEVRFKFF